MTTIIASALALGLGLSIVLLGSAETTLAAHDRDGRALTYASRAAAAMAVAELRSLPTLADVATTPGGFIDATLNPPAPWGGGVLDLRQLTTTTQAETDASSTPAARPIWRLFLYGSLSRLIPESAEGVPAYLVVWVADEGGLLLARAAAYGPGESRAITEVSLAPPGTGGVSLVRVLAVRPDP